MRAEQGETVGAGGAPGGIIAALILLWTFGIAASAAPETQPIEAAPQEEPVEEQESQEGAAEDETLYSISDVILVTASRTAQHLEELPAAMSWLQQLQIQQIPSDDMGDLLRNLPGLNVAQLSARAIQVTGRAATQALANSQLVLLDDRTLYVDHLGFVVWEFVPVSQIEVDQIEVVRGPGSAVWGANAMTGVINILTKRPSKLAGLTSVAFGGGELDTLYVDLLHAGRSDKFAYKVSAGYYEQDAYDRPTGLVPGTTTPYPPYENRPVEEPRLDLRLEYQQDLDTAWFISGGTVETNGNLHTPVGPWTFEDGSGMDYFKIDWNRRAMHLGVYANLYDTTSSSQVTIDENGLPVTGLFAFDTFHLDWGNTSIAGNKHILTYGVSARHTDFDITIAPGDSRRQFGVYLQDDFLVNDKLRWVVGARWDDIDPTGSAVSPRTSLLYSIKPEHTLRLSYNQAFRAPSQLENYIQVTVGTVLPLPTGLFIVPTELVGDPFLKEEELTAFEIGYSGTILDGRGVVTLAAYRSELKDAIDFFPAAFYTSENPPPGWPLPPFLLDLPPLNGLLEIFSSRNIGEITNEGIEASIDVRSATKWSWFANYSYQAEPEVKGISIDEVNIPPEHRINVGTAYEGSRLFGSLNVNWVDEAFWTDVLDARFFGPTDDYTMVNARIGTRLAGDKITFTLSGQNIFDERIQQHVFGDIISRKIIGEIRLLFDRR